MGFDPSPSYEYPIRAGKAAVAGKAVALLKSAYWRWCALVRSKLDSSVSDLEFCSSVG